MSTILRWHPVDRGGATIVIGGTMSPILMNAEDRGYKIIRRSNSLRFMIYSIIMHYKHRVLVPTCTNWGDKNVFAHQFTVLYPYYGIRGAAPVLGWLAYEELIWLFNYELSLSLIHI